MAMYDAPLDDLQFVINDVLGLGDVLTLERYSSLTPDVLTAVLIEAGKFANERLAPLNKTGDKHGCVCKDGKVTTPPGWKEAYKEFVANGWNSVPFDTTYGGQALPWIVASAISELWSGSNMAFGLCPLLNQGAVEALTLHGSKAQQEQYLPKLVSGEWTGTMCLTEPHAGSDVGAIVTQALPSGDHYKIKGQKIFITYGDHDMTDNIIHMVLARTPDASHGYKGISLFIVPKFLSDGTRNDVQTISVEHKLGIHGSPTTVLSFGDKKGAVGYLVGEEGNGLKYMFTMMNNARLAVGIEGVAMGENSYQQALAYAKERIQGKLFSQKEGGAVTIINHPDVKRMLLTVRANTQAMRALALFVAKSLDIWHYHKDKAVQDKHRHLVTLLIPVLKAHATDMGFEMSSLALQVFGGMGYVEETGIAQNVRDARIAMIYEGTNGIQALDLVTRKITAEDGKMFATFIAEAKTLIAKSPYEKQAAEALIVLEKTTKSLVAALAKTPESVTSIACEYLRLFGIAAGAVMMAASAKAAKGNSDFAKEKQETVEFYFKRIVPYMESLKVVCGG